MYWPYRRDCCFSKTIDVTESRFTADQFTAKMTWHCFRLGPTFLLAVLIIMSYGSFSFFRKNGSHSPHVTCGFRRVRWQSIMRAFFGIFFYHPFFESCIDSMYRTFVGNYKQDLILGKIFIHVLLFNFSGWLFRYHSKQALRRIPAFRHCVDFRLAPSLFLAYSQTIMLCQCHIKVLIWWESKALNARAARWYFS